MLVIGQSLGYINWLCYFGCFFDLLIDLTDLSRGPEARIYTISHIRTRMLYLT
jgi:hypothetical protein